MPVRQVLAHDNVAADRGRVALERGPLVYCLEATDNDGLVNSASVNVKVVSDNVRLYTFKKILYVTLFVGIR